MTKPVLRRRARPSALAPANDDVSIEWKRDDSVYLSESAANDNPTLDDLPPCLVVTNEEVRLLHLYLGQEILALFG
jgi:hypothetical protein